MQADISARIIQLVELEHGLKTFARLRAAALYAATLGIVLVLFAGHASPAQPLLPGIAGTLMGALSLPLLLASHLLLRLTRDNHRALVRHLFRRGHRVDYPEFNRRGEVPTTLRVEPDAPTSY